MKKQIISLLAIGMIAVACKKDKNDNNTTPIDDHGQETITTVILQVNDGQNTTAYTFRDVDGPGGNAAETPDTMTLNTSSNYTTTLLLINESETPADTISNELELNEHFICYTGQENNMTVSHTDSDGTYTVGLTTNLVTLAGAGTGAMTVSVKHQPGTKDGTCAPGETDVEVNFPFKVQ